MCGGELTLDEFVSSLVELVSRARNAKRPGVDLSTFLKVLNTEIQKGFAAMIRSSTFQFLLGTLSVILAFVAYWVFRVDDLGAIVTALVGSLSYWLYGRRGGADTKRP
jgi:hypothetical protein